MLNWLENLNFFGENKNPLYHFFMSEKCHDKPTTRVPSGTWKPGKPGDLNIICPGLEIAWNLSQKVRKPGQNKKF